MSLFRMDPGPCPICGVAHSACTADGGPVTVVQLPARDAAAAQGGEATRADPAAPLALGDGTDDRPFSTATYRGTRKGRRESQS